MNAVETLAYSRYNAMMFRLSRRFANNLSVNFNYTRSKIMDIVDNDSDSINNPFNIARTTRNAGYDQPNVATVDFVYMLPKMHGSSNYLAKQVAQWLGAQRHVPVAIGDAGQHHLQRKPGWE